MVNWTSSKLSDNRVRQRYIVQNASTTGLCVNETKTKTTTLGAPYEVVRPTTEYMLGTKSDFLGIKTPKFRPGTFRINPAVHRSVSLSCENTSVDIMKKLCANSSKYSILRRVTGPLALLVANGSTFTVEYPGYVPEVDASNVTRAYANANNAMAAVLTSAVELPMTLELMLSPLNYLHRRLRGLSKPSTLRRLRKNRNIKMEVSRWGDSFGYASDAWLQLRYGILPAMGEIETYRDLYMSKVNVQLGPIIGTPARIHNPVYTTQALNAVGGGWLGYYFWGTRKSADYISHNATLYTQRQWTLLDILGLNLNGVVGAAWERIPFSFVLDWFANFGDWLSAITPVSGVDIKGLTVSTSHHIDQEVAINSVSYAAGGYRTPMSSVAINKTLTYERRTDYVPSMIPSMTPYLGNLARMIDSVALSFNKARNRLPLR